MSTWAHLNPTTASSSTLWTETSIAKVYNTGKLEAPPVSPSSRAVSPSPYSLVAPRDVLWLTSMVESCAPSPPAH